MEACRNPTRPKRPSVRKPATSEAHLHSFRSDLGERMTTNAEAQQTVRTDVLVVGFGKGGKTVAKTLGRLGRHVVLVEESERMYGGTCPNVGCVPSKGMVHHSRQRRPEDDPQAFYEQAVRKVQ